jgi:uroporphyrinogen decarboxylase
LNPRERVLEALNHREPDRVPIDLGASSTTSIAASTYERLRDYLALPAEEIAIIDHVQQLAYPSEDLLGRLAVDTRVVHVSRGAVPTPDIVDDGDYLAYVDRWGIKLRMPKETGFYFDRVEFPIKKANVDGLEAYGWPPPLEAPPELRARAKLLYENADYALVGGSFMGIGGIFEQAWKLVGLEDALMAMLTDHVFAERLLDAVTDAYIEAADGYLDAVGEYLHVFTFADDICSQDSWIVSPEFYTTLIKPRQRRLFEAVKRKTNAKIFYHSCGAAFDLIPHLIDIGVDIINPVQVSATGMDTKRLKAAYGRDVVFWGGGVDTQHILPFATPQQVTDEVKRRIDDLAPGGGFVFAAVHNIQALVPPANVVAAFETAADYGRY